MPIAPQRRLFLTGYRGTGKSTVARQLAARLGWGAFDADDAVVARAGKPIATIFADDGEPAFRDLEQEVVAELCEGEPAIVALGGGAVLRAATRERLRLAGPVVWLRASPQALWERLCRDPATGQQRPNLTSGGGLAEIEQVLSERTPIYQSCADLQIDTEGCTPDEIADEIARWLTTSA